MFHWCCHLGFLIDIILVECVCGGGGGRGGVTNIYTNVNVFIRRDLMTCMIILILEDYCKFFGSFLLYSNYPNNFVKIIMLELDLIMFWGNILILLM